jgi:hypothetical protein
MNERIEKFLEFDGKRIIILARDGMSWIDIESLCEALKMDYKNQIKKINENQDFSEYSSEQTLVDIDGKIQKMICLPEWIIYEWILMIESNNPGLADLKSECCQVINDNSMLRLLARKVN